MAKPRKRYDADGKPVSCAVTIPPALAPFLYREKRLRGYKDETELVCAIIRKWTEDLDKVDWQKLFEELKKDDALAGDA